MENLIYDNNNQLINNIKHDKNKVLITSTMITISVFHSFDLTKHGRLPSPESPEVRKAKAHFYVSGLDKVTKSQIQNYVLL